MARSNSNCLMRRVCQPTPPPGMSPARVDAAAAPKPRLGHDEDSAERQQRAVRAGWVGLAQAPLQLLRERGPKRLRQRLQGGAGSGAADPFEHRVRAAQDVQIGRLPGVNLAVEPGQRLEVRVRAMGVRGRHGGGVCRVRRLRGQVPAQRVARLGEVPGTEKANHPPGATVATSRGSTPEVSRDPLQRRVRDQHVHRFVGSPLAQVVHREASPAGHGRPARARSSGARSRCRRRGLRASAGRAGR